VPALARGQPAGAGVGAARLERRGRAQGRGGRPRRGAGRRVRGGAVRPFGARSGGARPVHRGDQVRRGRASRRVAGADRNRPDLAGRVPRRRPSRRADGDPDRVRGAGRQPVDDPVAADRRQARQLLLLHRLRGAHRRRAGRRGDDGRAPGVRRGPVPWQLPEERRGADPGPPRHVRSRVRRSRRVARPAPLRPAVTGTGPSRGAAVPARRG